MTTPPGLPADAGLAPGAAGRVLKMWWAPEDVFAAIVRRPSLVAAGLALLLLIASAAATQVVVLLRVDTEAAIREALTGGAFTGGGGDAKEEDIEKAVKMAKNFALVGPAISVFTVPILFAMLATLFFLGLKIAGSGVDYLPVLEAVALGFWPPTLARAVVFAIVALSRPVLDAKATDAVLLSSLAAFAPSASPAVRTLLGTFDVFTVWTLLLLVIGLATVGRVKKGRAAAVVLGLFTFWTILRVAGAFAMSALQGAG